MIKLDKTSSILLLLLSPLLSVLLFIKNIGCNVKSVNYYVFFYFPLLGYLLSPQRDVLHIYERYISYNNLQFSDIFVSWRYDYFLDIILWIFVNSGILYHYIVPLFLFIGSLVFYQIYLNESLSMNNNIKKQLIYKLLFTSFPFWMIVTGLRNGLAFVFIFGFLYFYENKMFKKSFFYLLMGVFTHFSVMIIPIVYLFSRVFALKINKYYGMAFVFLSFVIAFIFFDNILYLLNDSFLADKVSSYSGGKTYYDDKSIFWKFVFFFKFLKIVPLCFFIKYFRVGNRYLSFVYLYFSFNFLLIGNTIMFFRYLSFVEMLFLIPLIDCINNTKISTRHINLLIYWGAINLIEGILPYYSSIYTSNFNYLIFPVFLQHLGVYSNQFYNEYLINEL